MSKQKQYIALIASQVTLMAVLVLAIDIPAFLNVWLGIYAFIALVKTLEVVGLVMGTPHLSKERLPQLLYFIHPCLALIYMAWFGHWWLYALVVYMIFAHVTYFAFVAEREKEKEDEAVEQTPAVKITIRGDEETTYRPKRVVGRKIDPFRTM